VDLETVIAQPELGAECAIKSFVLLGDQNAGKSTMLHRRWAFGCSIFDGFFFKAAIKYYESTLVNHIHFSLLPIDWLICGSNGRQEL
jgi:hypothetical protein